MRTQVAHVAYQHASVADVAYWKREAEKAIAERELVKKSLGDPNGPAAFWRRQAKTLGAKVSNAVERANTARQQENAARMNAAEFSEELDALKRKNERHRRDLWDVWSGLEDGETKRRLWELWTQFE